jgi:signal transduction histidine kinase
MRLPRILRTTSFRLTLAYAGLFCASVLVLFGAMFWFGTGYVADEIDRTAADEISEVREAADGSSLESLRQTVATYTKHTPPGVFYYLQDRSGHVLAGNVPRLAPIEGLRSWSPDESKAWFPQAKHGVRGRGVRVVDDAYLFVGLDSFELTEMREMIARAFLWGLLGTVLLALGGGAVMSLSLLKRVETISETSREIMAGDLGRRIPMRGSEDEFDHLSASLNAMLERIEGLMEGLRQVSTDIAHDLRTPLARLRQRLELARWRANTIDALHDALDGSIADVDAILETFAALLRIAQIEAHTAATGLAPLDLSTLLSDMLETYQAVAVENGRTLSAEIAPNLTVLGDRELLPQLFSNLIENAIRHCPSGSSIIIGARGNAETIEAWVADDGPGIPPELRAKALQRFFRLERSRTTEGTGLGLSLAAAVAGLHGARLELADNAPGLTVRVIFPTPHKTV